MNEVLKALAHPTRRRVLAMLKRGPLASGQIAEAFDVACPTMMVAGIDDRTVGLDAKHALVDAIAGARLVLVPDSGHVTNVDQPVAFNAVLREFLSAR